MGSDVEVTEADREKAAQAWQGVVHRYAHPGEVALPHERLTARIAQALADERAKTLDWVIDQISKGATFGRFGDPS